MNIITVSKYITCATWKGNGVYKKYMCVICGWVYDEEKGAPDDGIEPGTRWEDVPWNWQCPECGAIKDDFEMMEIE